MWSDRKEAGKELAKKLYNYRNKTGTVVYGLPRGGVAVAAEVAYQLQLPLDIVAVRKIGVPDNPELALGAVTADGEVTIDQDLVRALAIEPEYIEAMRRQGQQEAQRRLSIYHAAIKPVPTTVKTAILVDDGIATGATMRAAIKDVKKKGIDHIVVAVPVLPAEHLSLFSKDGVDVVYLEAPDIFLGVNSFYRFFPQLTDTHVIDILHDYAKKA